MSLQQSLPFTKAAQKPELTCTLSRFAFDKAAEKGPFGILITRWGEALPIRWN